MTKEQLKGKMKEKGIVVLNVLSESDFEKLHIRGSRSQPLNQDHGAFAHEVERQYGKGRSFVTYCADFTCAAGANAARILREHGFTAENYPGGIEEWHRAGWPTDGTQAEEPAVIRK